MGFSRESVTLLLEELAQWLEFEGVEPVEFLVCGGAAMSLQALIDRTTNDVDVLGRWNSARLEIILLDDFSEKLKSCIRRVAANHPELSGFGERWVNLGAAPLAKEGLPEGYATRLKSMRFGKTLTLHLLSRLDLIPLKLHAASDRFSRRREIHLDDLRSLKPTFEELDKALEWIRKLKGFDERLPEIQLVLESIGFDDLAQYI